MSNKKDIDYLLSLLPNPKTESWKYTNIKRYLPEDFIINDKKRYSNLENIEVNKNLISTSPSYRVWFKNDKFDEQQSSLPIGMSIKRLDTQKTDSSGFYFNSKLNGFNNDIKPASVFKKQEELDNLLKINNRFHENCYLIEFEEGFSCEQHIEINSVFSNNESSLNQQRLLFLIHPNSQVKLLEQVFDGSHKTNFHHSVSEFICLDNSFLEHVWLQNSIQNCCSVKTNYAIQKNNSKTNFFNFSLRGKMIRNNYHVNLFEPSSSANIHGFSCIKNNDHIDNFINVIHGSDNCTSSQLFKNIYTDSSSGVFVGGIYVDKNSQKTEAFQQNNNILLSEGAQINAIPQLEIFADDVMCSHGCTIGQPDFDAIFYLQSRGIAKKDAKALLNFAFLNESFKDLSCEKLKNLITQIVADQLNLNS